ncbi:MAG: hypothetical protein IPG21_04575 [Saprospiraceae bacterium]|nr:hypothetical protein [Candidatus Vicinibacter affinis]
MDLAGGYAAEVAEIEKTAEAWGIAGTTYMAGLDQMKVEKDRLYCRENSEKHLIGLLLLHRKSHSIR